MEGRLSKSLTDKISSLDINRPYVWRLKLSETDFNEIETSLKDAVDKYGIEYLAERGNALTTIIYLAEWYKREYKSGGKNTLTGNLDLEKLWTNAGISKETYLYKDDSGQKRWLYSIYVLGGLAIRHELARDDRMKFLKALCRIYHGEEESLENFEDSSRAAAFRESIIRKHSLYEYMKDILNGRMPFLDEELTDTSEANKFITAIKTANDEILRDKFRFEWEIHFEPGHDFMTRRLRLWMKPEEAGGGMHQYLSYTRVRLWGIPEPEKLPCICVYIKFKYGDKTVEPSTLDKPIIIYLNHSVNDFVAFGPGKGVLIKNIPTDRFDRIEVIVKDDNGKEYLIQKQNLEEYLQLWRESDYGYTWTSTQNIQKETALLFSDKCSLKNENNSATIRHRPFHDNRYGISERWNWAYIHDFITFYDSRGKETRLYSLTGHDQVTNRLYTDNIRYHGNGKSKHIHIADDANEVEELPLIFGKEDIIVRHFTTKENMHNATPSQDVIAEKIEYKRENGNYVEWNEMSTPPYGNITLRVSIKGKNTLFPAIFLPRMNMHTPIIRDFKARLIRYRSMNNNEVEIQDDVQLDGNPLSATIPVRFGNDDDYCEIDVYRPIITTEVMLDGKIVEYLNDDEKIELPYILKDRVRLNIFSTKGYNSYDCKNLKSIYTSEFINISANPSIGEAAMNAWRKGLCYNGAKLDEFAPECLKVCFGYGQEHSTWKGLNALFWSYDKDTSPEPINPDTEAGLKDIGVIFQDIATTDKICCNMGMDIDNDPWAWDNIKESALKCFEVANHHGIYFFLMKPLRDMSKNRFVKEIYVPLTEKRNGHLTQDDRKGLLRFAEEFGFDWKEFDIYINNEN